MKKGFTLIELILVIVILAILAVVAIPQYVTTLQSRAELASELGVVGGVRGGIHTAYITVDPPAWPAVLDSIAAGFPVTCDNTNPCFDDVLAQGGVQDGLWTKTAAQAYNGPNGGTYTYTPADGNFLCTANCP